MATTQTAVDASTTSTVAQSLKKTIMNLTNDRKEENEVTLLPNEASEDFICFDSKGTLSPMENISSELQKSTEESVTDVELNENLKNVTSVVENVTDLNNNGKVLSGKRSHDSMNGENEEDIHYKKHKELHNNYI